MRRLVTITIGLALALCFQPLSQAVSKNKLSVDCGFFGFEDDEDGSYRLFNPIAKYAYYGYKYSYTVYFTDKKGTPKSEQSKILGTAKTSPAKKINRTDEVPFEKKFYLGGIIDGDYYKAKYFEASFVFVDQAKAKSNFTCIWKR
jgi:hypothetical protein